MTQTSLEKDTFLPTISEIIDELMETETIYQQLSKDELMSTFSMLLEKPKNLEAIAPLDRETLAKRVSRVLATELLGTLLDGLTPEEVEMFNEAVKRK
jgi:hypothetical protein